MPRKKTTTKTGEMPANKQKGKKKCTCCHVEKRMTDFYLSYSPLFSIDKRVPICKECVKDLCINKETGEIDEIELNKTLRIIDKPYYKDSLASSYEQFLKEHSYIDEKDVLKYGDKVLGLYFKNIMLRQDKDKSYEDSEKDGFIHHSSNSPKSEKVKIMQKYNDIQKQKNEEDTDQAPIEEVKWTKKDKQNMKYAISTIGYDPYEDVGLSELDRKYCFNILAGYCDTEGIAEDGHKMQGVIEMTMLYCQCKKITEAMNIELSKQEVDDAKVAKLTSSKSNLLSSIATIAKDNNIASNYNKNSKQGQSSLTSKMKEMAENGYQEISVNMFDIKTAAAFKQIDEISNNNIANQLTLDNSDYTDIIKEQREMIQNYDLELETIKEENRILKNKIIDLESKKR